MSYLSPILGFRIVTAPGTSYARMNWGRWVVDCSSPYCTGALKLPPHTTSMRCVDCGFRTTNIIWPLDTGAIETLLNLRPDIKTRNCEPGENSDQILVENIAHGILLPSNPLGILSQTINGVVVGGSLAEIVPNSAARLEVGRSYQIGS